MATEDRPGPEEVTLETWTSFPHLRWGFLHTREVVPTAEIRRGPGPPLALAEDPRPVEQLELVTADGRPSTVGDVLGEPHADGILVLHGRRVVHERLAPGMTADTRHLLQSVSKSIAGSLAGVLVGEGTLDPAAPVTDLLPELTGSAWEGATVRHVLDMRTGTAYDENYLDPESDVRITEELGGWRPPRERRGLASLRDQIAALPNAREHGAAFEYRSILTDLLALIMERATGERYAPLLSTRLWAPMGAEHSADVTVHRGIAMADGGICATLRDLGRFGLLHLGGQTPAPGVVPPAWIADTRAGRTYRNQWWVPDPDHLLARGIHGQLLWIDVPRQVVCVKLATQPAPVDDDLRADTLAAFTAIAEHVAG